MYIMLMIFSFISKNICRSSTLSTAMELYGRSGLDWMFSGRRILTIISLLIYIIVLCKEEEREEEEVKNLKRSFNQKKRDYR